VTYPTTRKKVKMDVLDKIFSKLEKIDNKVNELTVKVALLENNKTSGFRIDKNTITGLIKAITIIAAAIAGNKVIGGF
jgi:5-enolpyruvylshikimate-3-phosphate synthase